MITTLFFDIGETLVDAESQLDALAEVHRSVLEGFGFPVFETILANADTKASEAAMIGDRLDNDIIPAKRVGMKTIWIRWGRYGIMEPRIPDEAPDATVSDVREVLDAVTTLVRG